MIRNYFRVIHFTIEKIIIGNTQLGYDVPGTFPKGSNIRDLEGTFRGLSGDEYKN